MRADFHDFLKVGPASEVLSSPRHSEAGVCPGGRESVFAVGHNRKGSNEGRRDASLSKDILGLSDQLEQLRLELRGEVLPLAPTLAVFSPRWLEQYARANRHKPRGISSKESILRVHLVPRFGAKRLSEFRTADIQQLKADLAALPVAPKTVNNVLTTLSKLLKTAVKWEVLERMPCEVELLKVEIPEVAFYEFEEYARLLDFAQEMDLRIYATVLLGGDAGLRLSEMIALEWSDCDFKRRQILICRQESQGDVTAPKGNKTRYVAMTDLLEVALSALAVNQTQKRVLVRDDGTSTSESTLRTWIGKAQRIAGFERCGQMHILRHTFCSHLAMRGAQPIAIQRLAGHQSLRTTERYMHLSATESRKAVELLNKRPRRDSGQASKTALSPTGFEPVARRRGRKGMKSQSVDSRRGEVVSFLQALLSELKPGGHGGPE